MNSLPLLNHLQPSTNNQWFNLHPSLIISQSCNTNPLLLYNGAIKKTIIYFFSFSVHSLSLSSLYINPIMLLQLYNFIFLFCISSSWACMLSVPSLGSYHFDLQSSRQSRWCFLQQDPTPRHIHPSPASSQLPQGLTLLVALVLHQQDFNINSLESSRVCEK